MTIIGTYETKLREQTLWIILTSLNGATLVVTLWNIYSLRCGFREMKVYDSQRQYIIYFYYFINLVPLLVAGCAHLGAQYPSMAIWIFPTLQIFLALNFFWFLEMLYKSAGGYANVQYHLSRQADRCGFPRCERTKCCHCCCLRDNLWNGMKARRLIFLYLIYVKPLWAFALSVMHAVHYDFSVHANTAVRVLLLLCTCVPLTAIKCYVVAVEPISRLDRIWPKLQLIRIMVPVLQMQQLLISFLVNQGYIDDLNSISSAFRGSRIEGTLLSFEMLIIAGASHFIYRADDLKHWEHKQQYQWEIQPKQRTITVDSDACQMHDDKCSDVAISELSVLSINKVPSSLLSSSLRASARRDMKQPLCLMPEDHSLRGATMASKNYQSLENH